MGLRRVPPSSEKMSHRRHRRNEAKYTPARNASKVRAVMNVWMVDSISGTTSTSNLDADLYTVCQSEWSKNITSDIGSNSERVAGHQQLHRIPWF